MVANRSHLTAKEVDQRLRQALIELNKAQRNAVLWFSEVMRRKLYRGLGYSSIYQYAELQLGFKKSRTAQFLRLSESLRELPALRRSVARGELSWTKAREVAKVATGKTEARWIREAKRSSNRELETRVKETRRQAARTVSSVRNQASLPVTTTAKAPKVPETASENAHGKPVSTEVLTVPMDVHIRMSAEQYARYQALVEALRKHGAAGNRAELLLAGLEQLVLGYGESRSVEAEKDGAGRVNSDAGRTAGDSNAPDSETSREPAVPRSQNKRERFTRVNFRSPYQVIVQQCPECAAGRMATNRGDKKLTPQELRTILCDAQKRLSGERNRTAVPDRLRKAVLERDRFRCRAAGCSGTSFLAVHHLVPREQGGANELDNLITLCSGCHQALHANN